MAQNADSRLGPAVDFRKFVVTTTVVISILRTLMVGGSVWNSFFSTIWYAILLYGAYRVARLQPWWPFQIPGPRERESRAEVLQRATDVLRGLRQPPVSPPPPLSRSNNIDIVSRKNHLQKSSHASKKKSGVVNAKQTIVDVTPVSATKTLLLAQVSTVGIRSKTVRHKVERQKTQRQKRRPDSRVE